MVESRFRDAMLRVDKKSYQGSLYTELVRFYQYASKLEYYSQFKTEFKLEKYVE